MIDVECLMFERRICQNLKIDSGRSFAERLAFTDKSHGVPQKKNLDSDVPCYGMCVRLENTPC